MYQTLLGDSSFYGLLLRCDEDLAAQARAAGCACGGVLHSARFPRKPRGGPADLGPQHAAFQLLLRRGGLSPAVHTAVAALFGAQGVLWGGGAAGAGP